MQNSNLNIDLLNQFISDLYKSSNSKKMTIENCYNTFIEAKRITKRIATVNYYNVQFKSISNFFKTNKIIYTDEINDNLLYEYIKIRQKQVSNATINKEIGVVKYMLNYSDKMGYIVKNKINIPNLYEAPKEIQTVDLEELKRVLKYIETKSIREQLIVRLIASTGIRRTEITFISIKNINLEEKSIYLDVTKNGLPRYIFLDPNVIELLKIYLKNNNEKYLFAEKGIQYAPSSVGSLFTRIKRDLNVKVLSSHKLRHTYATHLLECNVDIETIRLLLGHTTYEMTKKYLHVQTKKLKESSLKFNPLA